MVTQESLERQIETEIYRERHRSTEGCIDNREIYTYICTDMQRDTERYIQIERDPVIGEIQRDISIHIYIEIQLNMLREARDPSPIPGSIDMPRTTLQSKPRLICDALLYVTCDGQVAPAGWRIESRHMRQKRPDRMKEVIHALGSPTQSELQPKEYAGRLAHVGAAGQLGWIVTESARQDWSA